MPIWTIEKVALIVKRVYYPGLKGLELGILLNFNSHCHSLSLAQRAKVNIPKKSTLFSGRRAETNPPGRPKMSIETHLPSVQTNTISGPAPNGMGTGLFASSDIRTGEDVVKVSSPFVAVLDTPRLEDTCSGCFGKRQVFSDVMDLKACTGCQVVKYCDKTCQAKDWKFAHSLECNIFQKLKPNILPSNARAMLRMVLRVGRQKYNKQEFGYFVKLETHIRDISARNPEQWERVSVSAQAVKVYSESDLQMELIAAFGAKVSSWSSQIFKCIARVDYVSV